MTVVFASAGEMFRAILFGPFIFARGCLVGLFHLNGSFRSLRQMKATKAGREALVIANGPSAAKLDPTKVANEMARGLEVFAVNLFPESKFARYFDPTYFVLSDPKHDPTALTEDSTKIWRYLHSRPQICTFVPHNWSKSLPFQSERFRFFNDFAAPLFGGRVSPIWPRGFTGLTAYKALAIAGWLGYEKIYIIGFDNSYYLNFEVNQRGQLEHKGARHFFAEPPPDSAADNEYPGGMGDVLIDCGIAINDLHKFFRGFPITNLDVASNSSAFEKTFETRLLLNGDSLSA